MAAVRRFPIGWGVYPHKKNPLLAVWIPLIFRGIIRDFRSDSACVFVKTANIRCRLGLSVDSWRNSASNQQMESPDIGGPFKIRRFRANPIAGLQITPPILAGVIKSADSVRYPEITPRNIFGAHPSIRIPHMGKYKTRKQSDYGRRKYPIGLSG